MNAILLSVITFVSCTECPAEVREFLDIPIDIKCEMVKWSLGISEDGNYTLTAKWEGGGSNFSGTYFLRSNVYTLRNRSKSISLLRVNKNILQVLDKKGRMLPGGEGYANMLTRTDPVEDKAINLTKAALVKEGFVITGRTPLKPFDKELPITDNEGHDKIKWLIRFYADGRVDVRETLEIAHDYRGKWTYAKGIYKLDFEGKTLSLWQASDDIFFFVSKDGGLMNGNFEFGSALIRRH